MYVPPQVASAGFGQKARSTRPTSVKAAVYLIFGAIALELATYVVFAANSSADGQVFRVASTVAGLAIFSALGYGVWAGSDRARALYILLCALGIVANLLSIGDWIAQFSLNPLLISLVATQFAMRIAACVLLILPPSGRWFRGSDGKEARIHDESAPADS